MCLRARAAGGPRIAQQLLVYPVVDCDLNTESYLAPENQLAIGRDAMEWFWNHYATPDRRTEPEASPLRCADLSGLPPAVVITAEHDPLRDEGEAYAEALRCAGVPVLAKRFEGQMHGFFTLVNILPGSDSGLEFLTDALTTSPIPAE
jgi:Esterase/lipase